MAKIVDLHNTVKLHLKLHTPLQKEMYTWEKTAVCDKANFLPLIGKQTNQPTNIGLVYILRNSFICYFL